MRLNGRNDNTMESKDLGNNENKQSQERILKNTSYLTVSFILQKVLSFLYFIYLARQLGPVDLGLYDPIKSLIPILLILIDFSLSVVLVREIARAPHRAEEYLANVLGIKVIFAFIIILSMGIFTNFSDYSPLIKIILYLDAVIVALDTFTITFFAVFRGLQNMKFEALGIIGTQVITIIFGVTALVLDWGLQALFVAVVAGSVFNFIFSLLMLRKKLKIKIKLAWNKTIIKTFLRIAIPFAITAVFVKVFTYTDRFMLLIVEGQGAAGWYAVAHKLTYALEFIPSAFAVSIFPAMSAFYISSHKKLSQTFDKTMKYLLLISVPISVGAITLSSNLIFSLYGAEFETSIIPFRILMAGLVVVFLNFSVGAFLNACNRQVINTINMGITVAINIGLNVLFIIFWGLTFNGAAIAALVSGIVLFFLGLRWVGKVITYDKRMIGITFVKTIISAVIMLIVLALLNDSLSVFLLVPLGMIIYTGFLYALKGFSKEDIMTVYKAFIKKSV